MATDLQTYAFPPNFLFGVATAALQIEGGVDADGRGESIWERFCRRPGAIAGGDNPTHACGHYFLWTEDLDWLKRLGVDSYRFSISWPRVLPAGRGAVNAKGLDFYSRLVDGLLERGIKPNVTLYHWDLPQSLEEAGGWLNRDTAQAYADYAAVVARRLGDRVDLWATFNEPQIFVGLGYGEGVHAPGRREGRRSVLQAAHHVLLAHGLGLRAVRAQAKAGATVGIVLCPAPIWPGSGSPEDVAAAERHWRRSNDWWTLPLLGQGYPDDVRVLLGAEAPAEAPGDAALIAGGGLDWLGLNYYAPERVVHDASLGPLEVCRQPPAPGAPMADFPGWEIFAPGLRNLLLQYWRRYRTPLFVSENGTSSLTDRPDPDGVVRDPRRVAYLRDHLIHCRRALDAGVDLRGYYVWSLMDNFEWALGYAQRFGLLHVDYPTLKRTPKESFAWYAALCRRRAFEGPSLPDIRSAFEQTAEAAPA
jgi:beta-glucosidase